MARSTRVRRDKIERLSGAVRRGRSYDPVLRYLDRVTASDGDSERGPDFRIFSGQVEFGAGWKRTAKESGREYVSVKLEDPSFAAPIYCSLVVSDDPDTFNLIWNRPTAN